MPTTNTVPPNPSVALTIAPTATPTVTPTVKPGDELSFDLSQFSSSSLKVTLTTTDNQTNTLAEVPLLTDSIGFRVTIPTTAPGGQATVQITGSDYGEQITLPVLIASAQATATPSATSIADSSPTLLLILGLALALVVAALVRNLIKHGRHPVVHR